MPAKILNGRPMQAGREFHGNVDEAGSDAKPAMSISRNRGRRQRRSSRKADQTAAASSDEPDLLYGTTFTGAPSTRGLFSSAGSATCAPCAKPPVICTCVRFCSAISTG